MKRLIQFGDELNDFFNFAPFQDEEDWSDEVDPALIDFPVNDGAYRVFGLDQSRKESKTIVKRFVLYNNDLKTDFENGVYGSCRNPTCPQTGDYLRKMTDYMYRGLRGGVKKLYAVMEDGTIRYTWAEAVSIPYVKSFSEPKAWTAVSVEFLAHCPYWYEVNDAETFVYEDYTIAELACACDAAPDPSTLTPIGQPNVDNFCWWNGCNGNMTVIVTDEDALAVADSCVADSCVADVKATAEAGTEVVANGSTNFAICVEGSANAVNMLVGFKNDYTNPTVTLGDGSVWISYAGSIASGQRLIIDFSTSEFERKQDLTIDTNIPGFDLDDLTINSYELEYGTQTLVITGGTAANTLFSLNFQNRYHN